MPFRRPAAAAVAVLALTGAMALALDFDSDGVRTWDELDAGTHPLDPDSDRDGLRDGAERRLGTRPLVPDHDGDGLRDGEEAARGSDPTSVDSDGDGIADAVEHQQDCDGDGVPAIASSDDDGDGRPDGMEPVGHRCQADVDGDGVLDGHERNEACIDRPDCDLDGLADAEEVAARYDMLRADTFGTGLPDAVAYAFEEQGQAPTPDDDGDGIPDGWEGRDGAIAWGDLVPQMGQRDLLVEYLRVSGPQSQRYAWMDFTPAYEAVARMFEEQGIVLQWHETTVERQTEDRPDFLAQTDLPYFRSVLDNGTYSANPYVTSVVLNPQQVQEHGSILGAAFLRNMVASIDYGAHTEIVFNGGDGQQVRIRPVVESQIIGGLEFHGYDEGGVLSDGRLFLHRPAQPPGQTGYTMSWRPNWFLTAPYYETDDGQASLQLVHAGAHLHTDELAGTIAHELGHTLGLCHTHESTCQARYGGITPQEVASSTMSYTAQQTVLAFLDAEWDALGKYLQCPPQGTTALVAQDADRSTVLAAKYDRAFTQAVEQRECLELPSLPATIEPVDRQTYVAQPVVNAGRSGIAAAAWLAILGGGGAALAAFWVARSSRGQP